MITIASPIHVEAVGLSNVRYFAPPDGGREFPWPSLDDVFAAMALDRSLRRAFMSDIDRSSFTDATRRIVTLDGRTTVAQHYVAQGLIDAMREVGRCPPDLYGVYAVGGAKALSKLTEGFGPDDLMAYCADAMKAGGAA